MTSTNIPVRCEISSSDPSAALCITVLLDGEPVFTSNSIQQPQIVEFSVPDDNEVAHVIQWQLSGKTSAHTCIDEQSNIVSDALIHIRNIAIDNLNIDQIMFENAVYNHNFNGNGDAIDDQFFGTVGCNCTVTLKFMSPFYVWLLEHM